MTGRSRSGDLRDPSVWLSINIQPVGITVISNASLLGNCRSSLFPEVYLAFKNAGARAPAVFENSQKQYSVALSNGPQMISIQ